MTNEENKPKYEHKIYSLGGCMFETTGDDAQDERQAKEIFAQMEKSAMRLKNSMIKTLEQS